MNQCRDLQRRSKPKTLTYDEAIDENAAAAQSLPPDIGLQEVLRELPQKYRLPLLLHHIDGYSLEEIAPMLHVPISTLKGRIYQARKLLKTLLEKEAVR